MRREYFADHPQAVRYKHIVTVQPGHDGTCGDAEALVDSGVLAVVGLTHCIAQPPSVFVDDLPTVVCAAAVDDDALEVWIALQQHRTNGGLEEITLVVRRSYDGDARPGEPSGSHVVDLGALRGPRPARPIARRRWKLGERQTACIVGFKQSLVQFHYAIECLEELNIGEQQCSLRTG